jgi:hypothetical protein
MTPLAGGRVVGHYHTLPESSRRALIEFLAAL